MTLISVVIPTNNRSSLLLNAIKSVQEQTYKQLEIIVIDDASTDDTKKVVNSIKDNRIKYFKNDNSQGGSYSRNKGIENSSGDYIAFLDDDDEWVPEKLYMQIKVIENDKKIGLVYTGAEIIYLPQNIKYYNKPNKQGDLSQAIIKHNYIGTTSSVLIRKEILKASGGFDTRLPALQDYDLWIRICQKSRIGYVNQPLIKYYNYAHVKQISNDTSKYEYSLKLFDEKHSYLISQLNDKERKKRLTRRFNYLGKREMRNKNKKSARKYFIEAIKYNFNINSTAYYFITFLNYNLLLKIKKYRNKY